MPLGIIQQWRHFCAYTERAGSAVNSLFCRTPFLPRTSLFFCGAHTHTHTCTHTRTQGLQIEWGKIYEGTVTRNWAGDVTALWAPASVPLPQGGSLIATDIRTGGFRMYAYTAMRRRTLSVYSCVIRHRRGHWAVFGRYTVWGLAQKPPVWRIFPL